MANLANLSGFFDHPVTVSISERLGLKGFARLVHLARFCGIDGLAQRYGDWLDLFACGPDEYAEFVEVLASLKAFNLVPDPEQRDLVRASLGAAYAALVAAAQVDRLTIHDTAQQWEDWCRIELGAPNWLLKDPATQSLFRRWIASNVSLAEAQEAAQLAALKCDPSPSALHGHLAAIRARNIEQARAAA